MNTKQLTALGATLLLSLAACHRDKPAEGPAENAGKKVDNAAAETKEEAKEVKKETKEEAKETKEEVKKKTD